MINILSKISETIDKKIRTADLENDDILTVILEHYKDITNKCIMNIKLLSMAESLAQPQLVCSTISQLFTHRKCDTKKNIFNIINNYPDESNGCSIQILNTVDNKIIISNNKDFMDDFMIFFCPIEVICEKRWTDSTMMTFKLSVDKIYGRNTVHIHIHTLTEPIETVSTIKTIEQIKPTTKIYKSCYDYSSDEENIPNDIKEHFFDAVIIKPKKSVLTQKSIDNYTSSLKLLESKCDIHQDDYVNSEKVIQKLYQMRNDNLISNSVIKKYINGIQWFMNNNYDVFTDQQVHAMKNYKAISDKIQNKYLQFLKNGDMTESHRKNNIEKNELIDLVENSKYTASQLEFLVMKLYMEFPRRLDLLNLVYLDNIDDIKKFPNVNFYIKTSNGTKLFFQKFKNIKSTKLCDTIFDVPSNIEHLMDNYICTQNIKVGQHIFDQNISKKGSYFLQNIFKKYTGKKISVNIIRHSFASVTDISNQQLFNDAKKMSHSVEMHLLYQKKTDL